MTDRKSADFLDQLHTDGIVVSPDATLTPLAGGVSSDIYRVEDGDRVFVVKRALTQLKVADAWFADVSRNRFEVAYLQQVGKILPEAVPRVLAACPEHGYFTMEFLGDSFRNWKSLLLAGICEVRPAEQAGAILGTIHRQTWNDASVQAMFESTENFHQLRLEPYLLTTGQRHPHLRDAFETEARRVESTRRCLVHGDFSPKNILLQEKRFVILDCEVAWFGDPSFDVAFLLNHFVLKALHLEAHRNRCMELARAAWKSYCQALGAERAAETEAPLPRLLPMLMLARIDGKSPLEYLTDETKKQTVRKFVADALRDPRPGLEPLFASWQTHIDNPV